MRAISVAIAGGDQPGLAVCEQLLRSHGDIDLLQADAADTASAVLALKPRILLLALRPRQKQLLQALRLHAPDTRVVLLTEAQPDDDTLVSALIHGARGFVERSALEAHLVKAVRSVDNGEAWVPRRILGKVMDRMLH